MPLSIDYDRLYSIAETQREAFQAASPFPSIVIDDFFDAESYRTISECFPPPSSPIWKKPENEHTRGKYVTRRGASDLKERLYDEPARRVFFELNSSLFLHFLTTLTGISGLVPDPYFAEGGFHCSENGGHLDIHADFSHHDQTGLERRLNLLLYLNDQWQPEYGGELSLYDTDLQPVRTFQPIANRCIVFETSDTSYHGHPNPLRMPDGVFRKSIALYYYTLPTGRPVSRIVFPEDRAFTFKVTSD